MASVQNLRVQGDRGSSGSWEMWPFNKARMGNLQKFGNPVLLRPGDNKEDAYGFCGDLYCPNCGAKSDFMLVEFQTPSAELMAAWMNIDPDEIDKDLLRCPKCGRSDLKPT